MTNRVISFFETIGRDLEKVFGSTTWETKVLSTISYTEPFINGIIGLADPAIAPVVQKVTDQVVSDLTLVKTVIQSATSAPGTTKAQQVATALNSVKSNLGALLADAQVKNSTKVAQITAAVNLVVGEVDAVLGSVTP